jgi:dipeptidyl aminopeptidase/acylaminoacyl peptidase
MREAVPVNHNLQEELRKRLLMQGQAGGSQESPVVAEQIEVRGGRHPQKLFLPLVMALVLLVSAAAYWGLAGGMSKNLEVAGGPREVYQFWHGDFRAGFGLTGDRFLTVQNGNLVLMSPSGASFGAIKADEGAAFLDAAVNPGGSEVAFARLLPGGGAEIVVSGTDQLRSSFQAGTLTADSRQKIWASEKAGKIEGLSWSPDGNKLVFAVLEDGQPARVWVSVTDRANQVSGMDLCQGQSPAWSPDSKGLVVQRTDPATGDTLWLAPLEGEPVYLGRGRSPAWSDGGYLIYLTTRVQEKVISYTTDGLPRLTVRQPVDEIRWVRLGKSSLAGRPEGSQDLMTDSGLLLVPGQPGAGSSQELLWLRQLELSGDTEPQVLYLEQENYHHSMVVTPDGKKLYLLRDTLSGGSARITVTLIEVLLGERRGSEVEVG